MSNELPQKAWALTSELLYKSLQVKPDKGLSTNTVTKRLEKYGPNRLREHAQKNGWQIFWDQFKSLIILLLAVAAAVSFFFGEFIEGWAILIVIIINTAIGFFTELKAVRSMEALFKLGKVKTRVRRDGNITEVDARELVPGDIVIFEGGDIITADLRIIQSSKLQADESSLTGESLPVGKNPDPVAENTVLAERSDMLYKGTAVTRGSGEGMVVSTGNDTELGHISKLVEASSEEQTPLEDRLDKLGHRLIWLTLIVAVFVAVSGIMAGKNLLLMIESGIALAIAAIPEGLPIVATIALAKGMRIMAEKNALINRLSSVETLGATGIIFSDKTGTLTENRMTVSQFLLPDRESSLNLDEIGSAADQAKPADLNDDKTLRMALETAVLCNNAALGKGEDAKASGDPLEVALLRTARDLGMERPERAKRYPEVREEAFDPEIKMMATWNETENSGYRVHVKGAPGTVWEHCNRMMTASGLKEFGAEDRKDWLSLNNKLAADGLRLIALAYRHSDSKEGNPYENLVFVGLVALLDPPRSDVKAAIQKCKQAGIRVVMVTGDQKETARYIGKGVGLETGEGQVVHGGELPSLSKLDEADADNHLIENASIFARVSPQQKLDLIELYQRRGHIVAMTGDGVNDAPALKKANIGIAMGQRGTQVAKEAADMVLTDDAFSTIVLAIKQGRIIFGNIKRFIFYLLSCNVSEVLVVGLASVAGAPLPLLPLQILFLNLVTDVFPALALGMGEGEESVMNRPPRPANRPILENKDWWGIGGYGLLITAPVLGAFYIGLNDPDMTKTGAITLSFLTLSFAQLWHVFNMRGNSSKIFINAITRNPYVWGALALCIALVLAVLYIPITAEVLQLEPPTTKGWLIVIGMSLLPLIIGQTLKQFRK
jgi:Ca2+-transporting ATPase